jgi:hypothetical protein
MTLGSLNLWLKDLPGPASGGWKQKEVFESVGHNTYTKMVYVDGFISHNVFMN